MLPTIFTEKASKRIVSCEASSKFHKTKLPKRAFRAMLPTIFTEKASKMIVSCEASSKFHRTMLPKHNRSHAQDNARSNSESSKLIAFRHSFVQSTHRILREGSSSKIKMCVSLQRRAIQNWNACFATAACTKMYESSARRPRQPAAYKNHHFTTVSDVRPARSDERVAPATWKFAFHHSFGRPMSTKRRKGRASARQI